MRSRQLDLFALPAEALAFEAERTIASRLPAHVRFGTSSWTFPGWAGIVYPGTPTERELAHDGLEQYARHPLFRTVGIDRSYYRPLDVPTLERYAAQLPKGFLAVSKVFSEVTSPRLGKSAEPNPGFLQPGLFESEVLAPLDEAFAAYQGPLVFEFPPSTLAVLGVRDFEDRLERFLDQLPANRSFAVELRNRELLTPRYLSILAERQVGHVLNFWERMPPIGVQLDLPGVLTAPDVVARVLIPPGRRYSERKEALRPFDALVDPQEGMRADIVRLSDACAALGKVLYVIVNNKAEGSSPLTIDALARRIVDRRDE